MAEGDDGESVASFGASELCGQLIRLGTGDGDDASCVSDGEELAVAPAGTARAGVGAVIGTGKEHYGGHMPPPLLRAEVATPLRRYAILRAINWSMRTNGSSGAIGTAGGAVDKMDSEHRS